LFTFYLALSIFRTLIATSTAPNVLLKPKTKEPKQKNHQQYNETSLCSPPHLHPHHYCYIRRKVHNQGSRFENDRCHSGHGQQASILMLG
jgi:hypothetical protein|tara:strand:+ start:5316 stop:5585 length:270 start_codon:yes stop_codon:yes gene_type:complete